MALTSWPSILFSGFIVAWCILAILPVYVDTFNGTFKIITTILGAVPLPLVCFKMLALFIVPILKLDFSDPQTTNLPSFVLMIVSWIFSWATFYTIFWLWDRGYFADILVSGTDDAYNAFRFLLAGSVGVHVSDSTLHTSMTNSWLANVVGAQGFIGFMFTIYFSALILAYVSEGIRTSNKKSPSSSSISSNEKKKLKRHGKLRLDFN
jgi:hypothetical protein